MTALVAKSYQSLEQLCEPYTVNNKLYTKVRMKDGSHKVVRAYTENEYKKLYPDQKINTSYKNFSQRKTLGFGEQGFIWVFKGDTYSCLDWFRWAPTRYARCWGWYLPSDLEMPTPLPEGITPVKLPWSAVCDSTGESLKDEKEVEKIASTYIYDAGTSEWIGKIGDRVRDIEVICTRATEVVGLYGVSTIYIFVDTNGNNIMWTTTSHQDIEEESRYKLTGTIKSLDIYRGQKQTIMTRCKAERISE